MPFDSTPRMTPAVSVIFFAGDDRADGREHRAHAGARVRGTADHLDRRAGAGIDGADAQPIRVRVRLRVDHRGDDEPGERRGRVDDMLDLEADPRQGLDDRRQIGVRVEVVAEPGEREFHGV